MYGITALLYLLLRPGGTAPGNNFRLMNGGNFLLMNGSFFLLMGSY